MSLDKDKLGEQLSAYVDGELSEAEARRIDEALKSDADLAGRLEELRSVCRLAGSLPRLSSPADLPMRVLARAEKAGLLGGDGEFGRASRASWAVRLSRLATAAVVLIAVGLAATMVYYLNGPSYLARMQDRHGQPGGPDGGLIVDSDGRGETDHGRGGGGREPLVASGFGIGGGPVLTLNFDAPDLARAQESIEGVFGRNGIVLATPVRASVRSAGIDLAANNYKREQAGSNQVRYEVVIDTNQIGRIVQDINVLRANGDIELVPLTGDGHAGDACAETVLAMADAPRASLPEAASPAAGPALAGRRGSDGEQASASPALGVEKKAGETSEEAAKAEGWEKGASNLPGASATGGGSPTAVHEDRVRTVKPQIPSATTLAAESTSGPAEALSREDKTLVQGGQAAGKRAGEMLGRGEELADKRARGRSDDPPAETRIYRLKNAQADEVATVVTRCLGRPAEDGKVSEMLAGNMDVQVEERSNSLIVTAGNDRLDAIDQLLSCLDSPAVATRPAKPGDNRLVDGTFIRQAAPNGSAPADLDHDAVGLRKELSRLKESEGLWDSFASNRWLGDAKGNGRASDGPTPATAPCVDEDEARKLKVASGEQAAYRQLLIIVNQRAAPPAAGGTEGH